MVKRVLILAVTIALVGVLGVGAYSRLYLPSQQPVLTGTPPVAPTSANAFTAVPMSEQPEADRERFTAALRDAIASLQPGYHIAAEQLYVKRDGYSWAAVEKTSAGYFDAFGFTQSADARATFDGQTVDYLIWRPDWIHTLFDDRMVVAVALREPRPDSATIVFGYFELRPR